MSKITTILDTGRSQLNIRAGEVDELLERCVEEVKDLLLIKPQVIMYGKVCRQKRDIGFFSDESEGYTYSGQTISSQPITPNLLELMKYTNKIFSCKCNAILVNKYEPGDSIGSHSDEEQYLDDRGVIAISYGTVRKFRIRDKLSKNIILDIPTISGSYIHMAGDFQKEFKHEIPVEKKTKGTRYSFTFRHHTR